jgi:murein endopeptidase
MRSLVVAIGLLAFAATASEAKPRRGKHSAAAKLDKSPTKRKGAAAATKSKHKPNKKRVGIATRNRRQRPFVIRGIVDGQSVGACWHGALQAAVKLADGEGWYIRRPYRAYGTQATVDFVHRILADIVDRFPDIHDIAIGDISAERGGPISEHSSHQSGRDIDIGLIFTDKPAAYPEAFVVATAENLDIEATFVLVEELAKTSSEQGGVHMMFLDFDLQKLLYDWALENGEAPDYLARIFQYPHGRGAAAGIVRHEPHHADHIHVRFRCPPSDSACR